MLLIFGFDDINLAMQWQVLSGSTRSKCSEREFGHLLLFHIRLEAYPSAMCLACAVRPSHAFIWPV